jgi:hypothetical protein
MPVNSSYVSGSSFNPTAVTTEVWFKADNILTPSI